MQPHEQAQFLRAVGLYVSEAVEKATAQLHEKLRQMQELLDAQTLAIDEKDERIGELRSGMMTVENVIDAVKPLIPPQAEKFDEDKWAAAVVARCIAHFDDHPQIDKAALLEEILAALPKPAPAPEAIGIKTAMIDRSGHLLLVMSNGTTNDVGCVVGKDADIAALTQQLKDAIAQIPPPKDGQDGKDGFGFDDLSVELQNERDIVIKFTRGDDAKEFRLRVPFQIYRGVWRAGSYEKGDSVTDEGSTWIAIRETEQRPGTKDCGWLLAVKKGRDGKPGDPGKKGEPGAPGKPGRDLTQIGADGSRW